MFRFFSVYTFAKIVILSLCAISLLCLNSVEAKDHTTSLNKAKIHKISKKIQTPKHKSRIKVSKASRKFKKNGKSIAKGYHVPSPTQTSLIADVLTGEVLHAENIHHTIYPASLTKMMTLYLAFDELKKNNISMNTQFVVSSHAQNMRPSKLGLVKGQKLSVQDGIMALIVKSANDAAVTIAEGIGGSEEKFAILMNKKAQNLGMTSTNFANASGWHAKNQYTTALDMAKLGLALRRDFPEYYYLFKSTSFVFAGRVVNGHNNVLRQYVGAEGLKTGYTNHARFNLVTTASKDGKALIGVVTGHPTASKRDQKMIKLLDTYFDKAAYDENYHQKSKKPKKKTLFQSA